MKSKTPLDRLFQAAAEAPPLPIKELHPNFERRILAELRSGIQHSPEIGDLITLFRRGLIFATCVATATVALSVRTSPHDEADEFALTDAAIELALR